MLDRTLSNTSIHFCAKQHFLEPHIRTKDRPISTCYMGSRDRGSGNNKLTKSPFVRKNLGYIFPFSGGFRIHSKTAFPADKLFLPAPQRAPRERNPESLQAHIGAAHRYLSWSEEKAGNLEGAMI